MARFNRDRAANALADALVMGEADAAKRNGITERTLRNYKARLPNDPELSALFQKKKAVVDELRDREREAWGVERRMFLTKAIKKLGEIVEKADSVEHIHAIAGAVKIVGELDITKSALGDDEPASAFEGGEAPPPAGGTPGGTDGLTRPALH